MAAQQGHAEIVRLLIDEGANVNLAYGEHGATAIWQACQAAQADVAALLIEKRADATIINAGNRNLLCNIIETSGEMNDHLIPAGRTMQEINDERTAIAKLLLGPEFCESMLQGATTRARLESHLSSNGTDYTVSDALYCAASAGWLWMVEVMLAHHADVLYTKPNGAHPLYIACKAGAADCARALIAARANPNQYKAGGWSALLLAVQSNHVECVKVLIEAHADIDHRIDPEGPRGMTTCALMHACIGATGYHECVEVLLAARADPDRACAASGTTALFNACQFGWAKCACLLEMYGARRHTASTVLGGRVIEVDQCTQARTSGHHALADWILDTSDWVTPLHFWPLLPLVRIQTLLRDDADVHAKLQLPLAFQDARRHCHPSPMADARSWLSGQRANALWPSQAVPPRPGGNKSAVETLVDEAHATVAASMLVDACDWTPTSHHLFPAPMRARACDLLWLGHLLARSLEAKAEEHAFDEIVGKRAVELDLLQEAEVDILTDGIACGVTTVRKLLQQHQPSVAAKDPKYVASHESSFSAIALLDVWRDKIMPQGLRRDDDRWYRREGDSHDQRPPSSTKLSSVLYASRRRTVLWRNGTSVVIRDIASADHAHRNGTVGTIAGHRPIEETGRWPIRTIDGGPLLNLKPEKLLPAGLRAFH